MASSDFVSQIPIGFDASLYGKFGTKVCAKRSLLEFLLLQNLSYFLVHMWLSMCFSARQVLSYLCDGVIIGQTCQGAEKS